MCAFVQSVLANGKGSCDGNAARLDVGCVAEVSFYIVDCRKLQIFVESTSSHRYMQPYPTHRHRPA